MVELNGFYGVLEGEGRRWEPIGAPWEHESKGEGTTMGRRFTQGGRVDNEDTGAYERGRTMGVHQDESKRAGEQVEREVGRAVAEVANRPKREGGELARELEDILRCGVARAVPGGTCQCEHGDHLDGDGGRCHGTASLVKLTDEGRFAVCLGCVGRGHLAGYPLELAEPSVEDRAALTLEELRGLGPRVVEVRQTRGADGRPVRAPLLVVVPTVEDRRLALELAEAALLAAYRRERGATWRA